MTLQEAIERVAVIEESLRLYDTLLLELEESMPSDAWERDQASAYASFSVESLSEVVSAMTRERENLSAEREALLGGTVHGEGIEDSE